MKSERMWNEDAVDMPVCMELCKDIDAWRRFCMSHLLDNCQWCVGYRSTLSAKSFTVFKAGW